LDLGIATVHTAYPQPRQSTNLFQLQLNNMVYFTLTSAESVVGILNFIRGELATAKDKILRRIKVRAKPNYNRDHFRMSVPCCWMEWCRSTLIAGCRICTPAQPEDVTTSACPFRQLHAMAWIYFWPLAVVRVTGMTYDG
jgi:hypothetical protein